MQVSMTSSKVQTAKCQHFTELARASCILGIQETHGCHAQVIEAMSDLSSSHFIGASLIEDQAVLDSQALEHVVALVPSIIFALPRSLFVCEHEREMQSPLQDVPCSNARLDQ